MHHIFEFTTYAAEKMSDDLCKKAEGVTRDQKDNVMWHELRFGRITASNIYEASKCQKPNGSLVNRIIGTAKVYDTIYVKRGRKLEQSVIAEVVRKYQISINKCGLILMSSLPMFGALPDGIGSNFIVEIKCPS